MTEVNKASKRRLRAKNGCHRMSDYVSVGGDKGFVLAARSGYRQRLQYGTVRRQTRDQRPNIPSFRAVHRIGPEDDLDETQSFRMIWSAVAG
jgi:hypothetical protein